MKKEENFENQIKQLEDIVAVLEKGELNLEDTVKKFEEGIEISKKCNKLLQDAEKKITIILKNDDEIKEEEFSIQE